MPPHHRPSGSKGVEFSDHLIVLGPQGILPSPASYHTPYTPSTDTLSTGPLSGGKSLSSRSIKRRALLFENQPEHIPHENTSATSLVEPVETSCTDTESEDEIGPVSIPHLHSHTEFVPMDDKHIERCTRINTQLNSLPSGGAFSLMNSSEDVDSSSSDDESFKGSRKMIRVDGSAKLSTASGMGDEIDMDDDEFSIEGAEKVDEEEDVQVRSFGRSLAQARLSDHIPSVDPAAPTSGRAPQVAFEEPDYLFDKDPDITANARNASQTDPSSSKSIPGTTNEDSPKKVFAESKSAPPRRKSRMRLTFIRRSSIISRKTLSEDGTVTCPPEMNAEDSADLSRLSCLPLRRSATKPRMRNDCPKPTLPTLENTRNSTDARDENPGSLTKVTQTKLISVPEIKIQPKGMVKNVSMQRDDWIDFATNNPTKQRSMWLSRLVSSNVESSDMSSQRGSNESREAKGGKRRFWKFWRRR